MDTGKKAAIAGTLILLVVAGVRIGMIYHERHTPAVPVQQKASTEKISDDDLVFLKKKRPDTMADIKTLIGSKVWISAGGQLNYYPYTEHRVQYGKSAGTLLGAEPLIIKGAVEQVAPKNATFRIPGGDRQVSLVFTLPKSPNPDEEYATPVGYRQDGQYTFYTDEIFFYDDPHELYKHWGPEIWKAVDSHQVILGMNERQVQLALGQVSKSVSNDYGNRLVIYSNLGKPMAVTFVNNKVTAFRADQGF
jgi:hypothetical protein